MTILIPTGDYSGYRKIKDQVDFFIEQDRGLPECRPSFFQKDVDFKRLYMVREVNEYNMELYFTLPNRPMNFEMAYMTAKCEAEKREGSLWGKIKIYLDWEDFCNLVGQDVSSQNALRRMEKSAPKRRKRKRRLLPQIATAAQMGNQKTTCNPNLTQD